MPAVPIDPDATEPTRRLHAALHALAGHGALFGHQDDTAYGTTWWAEPGRSDVLEAAGDYPAVLGFDVGRLEAGAAANIDGVAFDDIVRLVREGHDRGAVITVSWHSVNPLTGGGYGENTAPDSVVRVLPGGDRHAVLLDWLRRFVAFAARLVDAAGEPIPVVFRPYHEHSGDWFWWGIGGGLNPPDAYAELWRFTVDHLRAAGVHHLLYAYSPDRSRLGLDTFERDYLRGYPGDGYVDVLGLDDYWDTGHDANPAPLSEQFAAYVRSLESVAALAAARGKIAALTETGVVLRRDDPWTGYLLPALTASALTRQVTWALAWRNAPDDDGGFWVPVAGTPGGADLDALRAQGYIRFGGLPR